MQKYFFVPLIVIICSVTSLAQTFTINQGEKIRMNEASNSIDIIDRDNTGVYILQGRVKTNRLSLKEEFTNEFKLFKFNSNYTSVYVKDLKDYDFKSVLIMNGELFWFATDYSKKENTFRVYGTKINKSTGNPDPGFTTILSLPIEEDDNSRYVKIETAENGQLFSVITR